MTGASRPGRKVFQLICYSGAKDEEGAHAPERVPASASYLPEGRARNRLFWMDLEEPGPRREVCYSSSARLFCPLVLSAAPVRRLVP